MLTNKKVLLMQAMVHLIKCEGGELVKSIEEPIYRKFRKKFYLGLIPLTSVRNFGSQEFDNLLQVRNTPSIYGGDRICYQ